MAFVQVGKVSFSGPHQGLLAHIERYRNSPVMHKKLGLKQNVGNRWQGGSKSLEEMPWCNLDRLIEGKGLKEVLLENNGEVRTHFHRHVWNAIYIYIHIYEIDYTATLQSVVLHLPTMHSMTNTMSIHWVLITSYHITWLMISGCDPTSQLLTEAMGATGVTWLLPDT